MKRLSREPRGCQHYPHAMACFQNPRASVAATIVIFWRQPVLLQEGTRGFKETIGGFRWCPPETITAGQAVDVATKFLRDNPAVRDAAASGLVAKAMYEAWPCRPLAGAPTVRAFHAYRAIHAY
jgi:Rap1a immunity proteins